jgi:hypothetical protein
VGSILQPPPPVGRVPCGQDTALLSVTFRSVLIVFGSTTFGFDCVTFSLRSIVGVVGSITFDLVNIGSGVIDLDDGSVLLTIDSADKLCAVKTNKPIANRIASM